MFGALVAVSGAVLAAVAFRLIHSQSAAPVLFPEAALGALLGAAMRRDIWGTVNALVIGLGWVRVLEVPSYVLLFFWFVYMLIGILFLSAPFADAPLLYFLPFAAFLWGFVIESIVPQWVGVDRIPSETRDRS